LILSDGSNRRLQFDNAVRFFVRSHNETLPVGAVRVCNPDCSPFGINRCDAAPTPTGFAQIVSDDFSVPFRGSDLPHAPRHAALPCVSSSRR
jgi:hypothetical protein